eukprot:4403614-Alexandrium_andersonii.AAC.1
MSLLRTVSSSCGIGSEGSSGPNTSAISGQLRDSHLLADYHESVSSWPSTPACSSRHSHGAAVSHSTQAAVPSAS